MSTAIGGNDLVVAINPCGAVEPGPRIVAAAGAGGGIGVFDLAEGDRRTLRALEKAASWSAGPIGVRVPAGCSATPADVERAAKDRVSLVILPASGGWPLSEAVRRHRVLVEVTSRTEARAAAAAGAHGLIARGSEAGGRCGELSTFVLLQQLLADEALALPVWAAGGIGPRTAAACVVGGAAGVVLDSQLALMPESDLPDDVRAVIGRMDGSETVLCEGVRGLRRDGRPDGTGELLPVGQDGWMAAEFRKRWGNTTQAVRGIRTAIEAAARDAEAGAALAPGAPLAQELGVRIPVAQGPMTRVSDLAGFAEAVAGDGALPFIALALATGEQSRRMLQETAQQLGERPWGVGVLGFAPEDVRAAQLEAVMEVRPRVVIIAGGRPAQAKALEADGINAFLHVPSPGLLRQFLRAGARRFVFEGAECGGHVGPRTSFALWEAQALALEEFLDEAPAGTAAQVQVFFAGGVHDARSAAMVAAMAGPLTRRGVQVGVLMGTAYLFTREAVERGAIQPLFQREVLGATGTALLETAPGHVTRCLHTPYVDDFHRMRQELAAAGAAGRQVWEQLEMLNVGRLRIASKGKRRQGDALVAVDEAGQRGEGLFMAGQVAVLRDRQTTVAALHSDVTTGAQRFHADRIDALTAALGPDTAAAEREPSTPLDVAIVGMSCVLPGSPDLAAFWQTILDGRDAIIEVPAQRWAADTYYAPEVEPGQTGRISVSKWGGFIEPVPFDAIGYGIPPAALASIDPAQLLALEAARQALADAGYHHGSPGADHSRTGVVFGAEAGSDMANAKVLRTTLPAYLGEVPAELADQLPTITEDSFPGVLTNVIAGRVANRLDLGGPNFAVDAACASALAAMDAACKELTTGGSDLMICGAVDLHNGIHDYLMFSSAHALSPTGRCRTFDSTGDGIALGEGVACVVLKRLADARRDGDRVYAVIKGLGAASDGRALGLTAPRAEGQRRALDRAYTQSGVSPRQVGLLEGHGTGTVVGDRTELQTLTRLFVEAGARPGGCALGSVKSQIGHTKCAAGLAGVIKAALALYTGVRPPTINLTRPNPVWDGQTSPFAFYTEASPWAAPAEQRIAGVSAFGFGGTNFHVVLAGHSHTPEPRHARDEWPAELFCFRGRDRAAAHQAVGRLAGLLDGTDRFGRPWRLRDLAATAAAQADPRSGPVQVAIVARDTDELDQLLRRALAGEHDPGRGLIQPAPGPGAGKMAFLFPGQGSQRPGALAELFVSFPELREYLELGREWADLLFPPTAFDEATERDQRQRLLDTRVAQPVLGIGGLAVGHLLNRLNIRPDLAAGHSYGELVALCVAGAYEPSTLLRLSRQRAEAILDATGDDPGTMAAVSATAERIVKVLEDAGLAGRVVLANQNSPTQQVISGPTPAVQSAIDALKAAGLTTHRLNVACAFHSPLVAGAVERFAQVLEDQPIAAPAVAVWSNRTATAYPANADAVRHELAAQVGAPVRFVEQIEAMYAAGARTFVETGPGQVLTRLVQAILGDRPHLAIPCDRGTGEGLRDLLTAVAQLACAGVPVQTSWLFHGRDTVEATSAGPGDRPFWTVDGQLVRDRDGNSVPGGLKPSRRIKEMSMTATIEPAAGRDDRDNRAGRLGQDEMLAEFLRTHRELIASHRDVMLAYLGNDVGGGSVPLPVSPMPASTASPGPQVPALPAPAPVSQPVPISPAPMSATAPVFTPSPNGGAGNVSAAAAPAATLVAESPKLDFQGVVLAVLSERTGYPADLIDLDLDVEADLSIDSIKRAEVAGEVAARLGLSAEGDESELEELVKARSVRAMVGWLTAQVNGALTSPGVNGSVVSPPAGLQLPRIGTSAAPAPAAVPATTDFQGAVLAVLSERTGYPADLIDLDLDLEADLSIDSIKRAEVAGEVAARLGLSAEGDESELEELVKARSVRAMVGWLTTQVDAALAETAPAPSSAPAIPVQSRTAPAAAEPAGFEPAPPRTAAGGEAPIGGDSRPGVAPARMLPALVPIADAPIRPVLAGATLVVTGPSPAAARVVELLGRHGATVRTGMLAEAGTLEGADGLVLLDGLAGGRTPLLPGAFGSIKQALAGGPRWVLAVADANAGAGTDGLRGLFRTIAREYPSTTARVVVMDGTEPADRLAQQIVDELLAGGDAAVVDRSGGARRAYELVPASLGPLAAGGAGPAGDGVAEARAAGLDRDSVVVLVGGARGITPWFARALASAAGCRIELVGRTPLPEGPQDPVLATATDEVSLRAALARQGVGSPAEIARRAQAILAGREVGATLRELGELGAQVRYHSVDVRDAQATSRLIAAIHGEYGRIDGLVYAAGVIEDKLIADKDPQSFTRVFDTKVAGARAVLDALDGLNCAPRFVVFFGSVAATYGNRGQADYAAANDALEAMGARWAARSGNRCLTVHWGPWAPAEGHSGMVTAELGREYARRGIALIDPEEGALSLLGELAWGDPAVTSVVYTASGW